MSELIELLKVALQFIFPYLISKNKTDTNRALELRKALNEIGHNDCETTLIKNINRKVSKELYDIELEANQIQLIEKIIEDSSYEIKWKLIKDSSPFLLFSQNELKVHFTKGDNFSNWFAFLLGFSTAVLDLYIIWFFGHNSNNASWSHNLGVVFILITILAFCLAFIFSTSNYFAARKLKSILKKFSQKTVETK